MRVRTWLASALAATAVVGLAACSGSSSGGSSGLSVTDTAKPVSLTVGIASPGAPQAAFYWALETGIFGKLVIGDFGTTGAFAALQNGRKMKVVVNEVSGNPAGDVVVKAGAKYTSLLDLSGQSIGVVGANGAGYGAATAYSKYITDHGGKALKIVIQPSAAAMIAAIQTGGLQAGTNSATFGAAIASGVLKELVKPASEQARSITGTGLAAVSYFGLDDQLKSNKVAVTRLIAGLRVALSQLQGKSADEVAAALAKNPAFAPAVLPTSQLVGNLTDGGLPFLAADGGFISKETWAKSLSVFGTWGLNVNGVSMDLSNSNFGYDTAVDMSYWNAATPLVNSFAK